MNGGTFSATPRDITQHWFIVDAEGMILGTMLQKHPERVIEKAVYGMLPKTALGRQVLRRKLRVYANAAHPHVAQQPTPLTFSSASAK